MLSQEMIAVREAVREYCVPGHRFFMSELTDWVRAKVGGYVSPETPGRRLRELRTQGWLNYRVSNSIYEVLP
jgi:hypothetical protein